MISKELEKELVNEYVNDIPIKEIQKRISVSTLYRILRRNKISINRESGDGGGGNKGHFKYKFDNVFEYINSSSAYWLGILFAEGCICINGLQLEMKDREHIEKFIDFINPSPKIKVRESFHHNKRYNKTYSSFCVRINNKEIIKSIENYGFQKEIPASQLQDNIDFWRGVIDGDGSITWSTKYGYLVLDINGTHNICKFFKKFCSKYVYTDSKILKVKGRNVYSFRLGGSKAEKIIKLLYYNGCKDFLIRRMNRVQWHFYFSNNEKGPFKSNFRVEQFRKWEEKLAVT